MSIQGSWSISRCIFVCVKLDGTMEPSGAIDTSAPVLVVLASYSSWRDHCGMHTGWYIEHGSTFEWYKLYNWHDSHVGDDGSEDIELNKCQ